jgi:tRNA U34 5-carboxymethylaminomethyl modifying GTPase MnmE/TrmE
MEDEIRKYKCVDEADLIETRNQLQQNELFLAVYGQYNVGKSTLLNAIFKER